MAYAIVTCLLHLVHAATAFLGAKILFRPTLRPESNFMFLRWLAGGWLVTACGYLLVAFHDIHVQLAKQAKEVPRPFLAWSYYDTLINIFSSLCLLGGAFLVLRRFKGKEQKIDMQVLSVGLVAAILTAVGWFVEATAASVATAVTTASIGVIIAGVSVFCAGEALYAAFHEDEFVGKTADSCRKWFWVWAGFQLPYAFVALDKGYPDAIHLKPWASEGLIWCLFAILLTAKLRCAILTAKLVPVVIAAESSGSKPAAGRSSA